MVQAGTVGGRILLIVGPTASGKSELGERLAIERGGEILNADSQQFYRGMDIGTGKVRFRDSPVRHWLFDICEPGESMNAMEFARRADETIRLLEEEKKIAVIVGGTGLYVRALLEGFDSLPSRNPQIRERLKMELEAMGSEPLYLRLKEVDPEIASRVHPNDPSRIIRFLEIYEITGRAVSPCLFRRRAKKLRYQAEIYCLNPSRDVLREKIENRVRGMIEAGWVEEVRQLMARGTDPRRLPNKPIGYQDLAEVVSGNLSLQEAEERIVLRTRQYAKRQATFFRGLFKNPAYQTHGSVLHFNAIAQNRA